MNALQFYEYERTGIVNPLLISIENPVCGVDCALCDELADGFGETCPSGRYNPQGLFGEKNTNARYGFFYAGYIKGVLKELPNAER